jgi:uncharacterized protein YndB with AHSA1/START domain
MERVTEDRIEKTVLLRSPKARVWRALTNADEFGQWFRVKLEGSFSVGERIRGRITYPGYEHLTLELTVEKMEREQLFSFRWHPNAVDSKVDYSSEPTTLVEFRIKSVDNGTLLTLIESGFASLPPGRRIEAFRMNSDGWSAQIENIRRQVEDER